MPREVKIKFKNGKKYFYRFTANQRFQHITLFTTVIILALTGMPLRYPDAFWAETVYNLFGGIQYAPTVHRVTGVILILLFIYHLGYLAYNFYQNEILKLKAENRFTVKNAAVRLIKQPLVPNWKDVQDVVQLMKYLTFISKEPPRGDQYIWKEKFDYWAPFWGIAIIGGSGLLMWQEELVSQVIPGFVLNFALIAHSEEALLAVLFLFIWHFYNVHFSISTFPMSTVFLTGYLPEEQMVEHHYDYYLKIMRSAGLENEILPPPGSSEVPPPPKTDRQYVEVSELPRIS